MTLSTKLRVLDPTAEAIPIEAVIASRPDTLDGKVLGLLANGKPNSVEMLEMVREVLADRFEFKEVVARNKGNASRPAPPAILDELADLCDLVITSSGD